MRAASHIGRVGGLAVALGVGTAIFTGAGVAHATEGDDSGAAPTGQEQGGGGTTTAVKETDPGGPDKIDFKLPRLSDIIGRHRADDTTPNSNTADSIVKRLSDAAKRVTDAIESAADADNTVARTTTTTTVGSSTRDRREARAERVDSQGSTPENLTEGTTAATNNVVANHFVNRAAAVKDWIASPLAAAGRSVDTTPPVPTPTPLWTPPQNLAPLGTMKAAPGTGTTAVRTTSILTSMFGLTNPFAGNTPGSPVGVNPLSLVLAGAARREIGIESYTPQALLAPTGNSLTYAPVPTLLNGVITGTNPNALPGLTYTVVGDPSGGGKVLLDANGNYTFLPNYSSLQSPTATESFKVLVAETTPFTTAVTQIPILGSVASQLIVVLQQIPVVNVVLSPLIGRSTVKTVIVPVGSLVYTGTTRSPVAFTVMVPSDDGVMISTNYFPAYSVVASGGTTDAPTILNGPGLATAGNIDPNAPDTVDGLVPGINYLRAAGYNVVTWDPRGEFDSTGRLELDSPEYEGQDVKNIITWVTANTGYTHQDVDDSGDPWIGMVGGSYGGGIQWAASSVDPRIDVITPGISWNTLTGSLYTNEAFKTSYASLLLLGLVQSGSRINPEIYAGIITGDILGILTPSQQALLNRSGPGGPDAYIQTIDIPAMLIQGTVDVLFPLEQSILNTEGLTASPAVKVIWYCGGHGVCLTMNPTQLAQQETFLRLNTIAWLDTYLPEADGTPDSPVGAIPTFQFVDQNGDLWKSNDLPQDFTGTTLTGVTNPAATGGHLVLVPVLGGSGPQSLVPLPYSLGLGAPASNAITVPITPTLTDTPNVSDSPTHVVGSPHLTFDYSGVGTSRHVYAQIVDKNTGLVVGNIVTPVDVTLDGRSRTADIDMEDIAWTYTDAYGTSTHPNNYKDLELQITSSATAYENFTAYGYIDISNVQVTLPTAAAGQVAAGNWNPSYLSMSA